MRLRSARADSGAFAVRPIASGPRDRPANAGEPRRSGPAGLACAGSVIGSMILFFIARKGVKDYLDRHTMSGRGALFHEWFMHYGLLTVFVPALSPVPTPMKLFVICAGAMGCAAGSSSRSRRP